MSDLIERLRQVSGTDHALEHEAADEIERLQARVEALERVLEAAKGVTGLEHRGGWTDYVPGLYELRMAIANSEVET